MRNIKERYSVWETNDVANHRWISASVESSSCDLRQVMCVRVWLIHVSNFCGPIFTEDHKTWDKCHHVTWRRGSAPRDFAHATNYRDNRPSTYQRNQSTQSHRIDVKIRMGWTAVRYSTTPSGIERTKVVSPSRLTGVHNITSVYSENRKQKGFLPASPYIDIYIVLI